MSIAGHFGYHSRIGLAALLLASSALISGCSSRDAVLSDKLAAADAAAARAEKAAERAEKAAGKADKQPAATVHMDAEPSDLQDPAQAEKDQQAASAPSIHG